MKTFKILIFALTFALFDQYSYAQSNLIRNPGFEYAIAGHSPQCDYTTGGSPCCVENDIQWWSVKECDNTFNACDYQYSDPDWMHPLCGSRQAGLNYPSNFMYLEKRNNNGQQDAVGTGLINQMVDNQWYLFKIVYISTPLKSGASYTYAPRLKVYLTKYGLNWHSSYGNTRLIMTMYPPSYMQQFAWQEHWICFSAPNLDDINNITLACENGAMYIDHVQLYKACPSTLLIQDQKFYPAQNYLPYKTLGTIKLGRDIGSVQPVGDVVVVDNAVLELKAANVEYFDGWDAQIGSTVDVAYDPICNAMTPNIMGGLQHYSDVTQYDIEYFDESIETVNCGDTLHLCGVDGDISSYSSFNWDFGNGQTSTDPCVDIYYDQAGTYTVSLEVTDLNGGTETLTMTYVVPACRIISNINLNSGLSQNNVSIKYIENNIITLLNPNTENPISTVQIFDLTGRLIHDRAFHTNSNFELNSSGVYVIKVQFQDNSVDVIKFNISN